MAYLVEARARMVAQTPDVVAMNNQVELFMAIAGTTENAAATVREMLGVYTGDNDTAGDVD